MINIQGISTVKRMIQMIEKMCDYVRRGNLREALIIGQNLFARNSGNPEIFKAYVDVVESVMNAEDTSDGKIRYFQQLSAALTVFSETVSIDDSAVEFIMSQEDRLAKMLDGIQQIRKQEEREFVKQKIVANDDILSKLPASMDKLKTVADKTVFDTVLQQIQQYDSEIDKDYLTDRQREVYEAVTRQCSKIVDIKLRAFQRMADAEYNERALDAYERVYQYFKSGKVPNDHKEVISGLFGFDAGKLFNETLTYYNHVYAYVLSKLDDDGKFRLTKAAIRSEMRR